MIPEVALTLLPPRKSFLSITRQRPPRSRTVCAADRPARPPPTTITCGENEERRNKEKQQSNVSASQQIQPTSLDTLMQTAHVHKWPCATPATLWIDSAVASTAFAIEGGQRHRPPLFHLCSGAGVGRFVRTRRSVLCRLSASAAVRAVIACVRTLGPISAAGEDMVGWLSG